LTRFFLCSEDKMLFKTVIRYGTLHLLYAFASSSLWGSPWPQTLFVYVESTVVSTEILKTIKLQEQKNKLNISDSSKYLPFPFLYCSSFHNFLYTSFDLEQIKMIT
jgi:hypothetical protein